ncbi:glycosyltransferase family 2 protein [Microbacterium esteraromaticum]|uniref:glycosyltransferase family 2 protein n=1 Tax=Microbacterium esteraromaticum TaxID=57043 RepID=UPI00236874E7|nr:glycosyltransferase family 2 protein [Microbacterium esteraromaticum]WDH79471.1 glycosyltransferase family 2 protein [Microbacterium esteraromaticum]
MPPNRTHVPRPFAYRGRGEPAHASEDGDLVNERSAVVVVATYRRPDHVRKCLEHLREQTVRPRRVVVVDASPDELTRKVVESFRDVEYRRNDLGVGTTATSRAIGVQGASEDVIVFIDDDAYAEAEWLGQMLIPFENPLVGGVGGRARNGQAGEEDQGRDRIGRLLRDGQLTGNFAADPGHVAPIDHMLGASMAVRADALRAVGGIRDYYPGTCLREETDVALRIKKAGFRLLFAPRAVVLHVAGEYAKGRRFDMRYRFYGSRNQVVLIATTLGWTDPHLARSLARTVRQAGAQVAEGATVALCGRDGRPRVRALAGGIVRGIVDLAGMIVGLAAAIRPRDRAAAYSAEWRA